MQAESSYNCCRLQHGCRFVQLQVLGCKLLHVTCEERETNPVKCVEGRERVSARAAPGWVGSGSNGDGAQRAGRAKGGAHLLLASSVSFKHMSGGERVPCLSTLSIYKNAAIPARLVHQHTAAAPVAWIPWR